MRFILRKGTTLLLFAGAILVAVMLCEHTGATPVKRPASAKTPAQMQAWDLFVEGTKLLGEKKPFKARKVLEQAARLWPQSAPIHYNLGYCYHDCGLYRESITEFEAALRIDATMTGCINNIANSYQQLGQTRKAIAWLEVYLKSNPPDADQTRGLIGALEHADAEQILSDPQAPEYIPSVCKRGKMQRWPLDRLPLRVYFSNGCDMQGKKVKGFKEDYLLILKGALDEWMQSSGGRLSYVAVGDHRSANIICTWTDDLSFPRETNNKAEQGLARIVSHDYGRGTDEIEHVDLTILVLDRQSGKPLGPDEMKTVCLHELGHALGLNGHSPNNRDVMFFSMAPSVWPSLTKRDRATIFGLYRDYPERQLLEGR